MTSWHRFSLFCIALILITACGGGGTETDEVATVVPTAAVVPPIETAESSSSLPPTFTPSAEEIEQPTPVTPAPTPTDAPATAVVELITVTPLPDARQLLLDAEDNLRGLLTFSHERSITLNSPAFDQSEDVSCVLRAPDEAFCHAYRETIPVTGDATVRDFEFVQNGARLWARGNSQAAWEELPPDDTNYLASYTNQLILSPYVTDAFVFGQSAVDDVPVYELHLTLDPVAAVRALYSGEGFDDLLEQAGEGEATARAWVGQEDRQLRLLTIEIRFDTPLGDVTLNGLGSLANFNETAAIPEP